METYRDGDVIDAEFNRRLGDDDLIEAIIECNDMTRAQFDALPKSEQHAMQLGWVSDARVDPCMP
jgi:hypothetical protein